MHALLIASTLASTLASTIGAAPEWTLLALPRGTRATSLPAAEDVLLDAAHLDVAGNFRPAALEVQGPAIAPGTFQQMLDETLRLRGLKLESRPQAGLLLARGDPAALELARALVADLDRQLDAFEIDLEVVVRRAGAPETTWKRRVRAGADVFLGSREVRPFVASFDVQVAQDAGQAEPRLGSALSGTGLHVRATRLAGGTRVFLDGVLDTAELDEIVTFDPETPDLGVFDQPRIASAQVAFAGAVDSGGSLRVNLAHAGPSGAEFVLTVKATARPDVATTGDGWALLDLGFAQAAARPLLPVDPGANLASVSGESSAGGAILQPAALAAMLEGERAGSEGRASRSSVLWGATWIAFPRSDAARIDTARALVRSLEEARSRTARAEITCGTLVASFPVASGRGARLVAGTERPYLVDYALEVAPQIWMPAPRVERGFDGIAAEVAFEDGQLRVEAWRTSTPEVAIVSRESAQMGRLELPRRARVVGSGRVTLGEAPLALFDAGEPLAIRALAP